MKKHAVPAGFTTVDERPAALERTADGKVTVDTGKARRTYDGVFIFRTGMPLSMLLDGLQADENGIAVDRGMRTNIPGVFAAGDCTGKPLQVAKAAGEGNVAAISAAEYIQKG